MFLTLRIEILADANTKERSKAMNKIYRIMFALVIGLTFSESAHAALWDRGSGLIFDDVLNITWLQDANYARTSGYEDYDPVWAMNWKQAKTWADTLIYGGYDDWRLPTALNMNGSGPCSGYNCTGSEMGYMYYINLGNAAYGPLANTSFTDGNDRTVSFTNLVGGYFWSSTILPSDLGEIGDLGWDFSFSEGLQISEHWSLPGYAWAVRTGDVASVPEPSTLFLLGTSLAGLVLWVKGFGQRHI
jgi:hypothetical protein